MIPFLALLAALASADSTPLDPTRVHRFVLTEPEVPRRSTRWQLPASPAIRWRVRVAGGLVHPPAAAADGSIVVAHAQPTIAKYDPVGRLLWTARLGATAAARSPIVFGDRTALVLTEGGEAIRVSERGSVLSVLQLPLGALDRPVLGAGADGNLLVADGKRLVSIDGSGVLAHLTELEQEAVAIVDPPGSPLAVGSGGVVVEISKDGAARRRWDLGGKVSSAVRRDAHHLWAVIDREKLVELDLVRGTVTTLFADPALTLGSELAMNAAGDARVLAGTDLLLALRKDGQERFRTQLPPSFATASVAGRSDFVLDRTGVVMLVHAGSDALAVLGDGSVVRIDGTACPEPLRPVALDGQGAVLACRSGVLVRIGQRR